MKDQLNVAIFSVDYSSDNQCVKKKCARSLYSSFLSVMVRLRKESGTRAQNRGSGKGGVEERRKLLCRQRKLDKSFLLHISGIMHKTQVS